MNNHDSSSPPHGLRKAPRFPSKAGEDEDQTVDISWGHGGIEALEEATAQMDAMALMQGAANLREARQSVFEPTDSVDAATLMALIASQDEGEENNWMAPVDDGSAMASSLDPAAAPQELPRAPSLPGAPFLTEGAQPPVATVQRDITSLLSQVRSLIASDRADKMDPVSRAKAQQALAMLEGEFGDQVLEQIGMAGAAPALPPEADPGEETVEESLPQQRPIPEAQLSDILASLEQGDGNLGMTGQKPLDELDFSAYRRTRSVEPVRRPEARERVGTLSEANQPAPQPSQPHSPRKTMREESIGGGVKAPAQPTPPAAAQPDKKRKILKFVLIGAALFFFLMIAVVAVVVYVFFL